MRKTGDAKSLFKDTLVVAELMGGAETWHGSCALVYYFESTIREAKSSRPLPRIQSAKLGSGIIISGKQGGPYGDMAAIR
jgi:hypothetical protein